MTTRILALCNQKGGVGKSTTTFHLARAAITAGQRVLVEGGRGFAHAALLVTKGEDARRHK